MASSVGEDAPLLALLAVGFGDRRGPLHVRLALHALHERVEVFALELVGGGQHVVGELTGGVAVQVDADEQVERAPARPAAGALPPIESAGLPATTTSARSGSSSSSMRSASSAPGIIPTAGRYGPHLVGTNDACAAVDRRRGDREAAGREVVAARAGRGCRCSSTSIWASQYASEPWRPMLRPVDTWTDAPSAVGEVARERGDLVGRDADDRRDRLGGVGARRTRATSSRPTTCAVERAQRGSRPCDRSRGASPRAGTGRCRVGAAASRRWRARCAAGSRTRRVRSGHGCRAAPGSGSATLRNDVLLTRGFEPITSSSSVRSRSGIGFACATPVEQLGGRRTCWSSPGSPTRTSRSDPRVRTNWNAPTADHRVERVRVARGTGRRRAVRARSTRPASRVGDLLESRRPTTRRRRRRPLDVADGGGGPGRGARRRRAARCCTRSPGSPGGRGRAAARPAPRARRCGRPARTRPRTAGSRSWSTVPCSCAPHAR